MSAILNPYLHFNGNARDAMKFYESVFGGDLTLMTWAEGGNPDAENPDGIMHGQLTTPSGFTLMASDGGPVEGAAGPSISLSGDAEEELSGYYDKLRDGGTVIEPLAKAPWGDSFGMCSDRFGITWMVNISGGVAAA